MSPTLIHYYVVYISFPPQLWETKLTLSATHLIASFLHAGFPASSVGKESACKCRGCWFSSWVGKIRWRRDRLPTPVFSGFPCGSAGKESTCNARDLGLISGLGRSPGEGKGYPLQYSGLENSMDCEIHGVVKSPTRLSNFPYLLTRPPYLSPEKPVWGSRSNS